MKKIILPITLLLIFLVPCTAFAFNDLHLVVSNKYNIIYIDNDSIKYGCTPVDSGDSSSTSAQNKTSATKSINTNIITFSQTVKFTDEGLKLLIDNMQKEKNHSTNWDKVSYFITFNSINVENKTIYTETQCFYDNNAVLLYTWHGNKDVSWSKIAPYTVVEKTYKYISSYAKSHDSKLKATSN